MTAITSSQSLLQNFSALNISNLVSHERVLVAGGGFSDVYRSTLTASHLPAAAAVGNENVNDDKAVVVAIKSIRKPFRDTEAMAKVYIRVSFCLTSHSNT